MKIANRNLLLIGVLGLLHIALLFPGFFAPYSYAEQNRDLPFAPPTRLHFVDATGEFHFWPFVYSVQPTADDGEYVENRARAYPVRLFVPGAPYTVVGSWTMRTHLFGVERPGQIFLFGTDDFGRDELSRMFFGGRISLLAGVLGAGTAVLAGAILGVLAGFYGGWIDALVMRVVELFLALPWLYLLFAVRATLPLRIKTTDAFLLLVVVVGLVGWARPARLVRGIVLSAKERTFVRAARAMGASDAQLLRRHVLPETYGVLSTTAALLIPQFILAEVSLSFLGLGVGEPIPSWGNLLAELQKYSVLTSYWWMYLPAAALMLLFLAYHWASTVLQGRFAEVRA
ncbi:MAG TPA: ABC transporter permease [Candidatus Acidoferrum sp.]|jgi:peptide/nickel transport system permease protein